MSSSIRSNLFFIIYFYFSIIYTIMIPIHVFGSSHVSQRHNFPQRFEEKFNSMEPSFKEKFAIGIIKGVSGGKYLVFIKNDWKAYAGNQEFKCLNVHLSPVSHLNHFSQVIPWDIPSNFCFNV